MTGTIDETKSRDADFPDAEIDADTGDVRRGGRRRYGVFMRWTRRIHMYIGLFMLPWVLVYGTSALFFNHHDLFPDHEVHALSPDAFESSTLASLPEPAYYARQVVAGLKQRGIGAEEGKDVEVIHPENARFVGYVHVTVEGNDRRNELFVDPTDGDGFIRSSSTLGSRRPAMREVGSLDIEDPLRSWLETDAAELLEARGMWAERVIHRSGPQVEFDVMADGEPWRVTYDVGNRSLSANPLERSLGSVSVRAFLTNLHLTHRYPAEMRSQSMWAVAIDFLASGMIIWGLSGILMWWQMPKVRMWGGFTLVASTLIAGGVGYAMYAVFTN